MKVLVTGGAGFIGSHTVVELINKGYQPMIVDDFRNSQEFILDRINQVCGKTVKLFQVDCGDYDSMEKVFIEENPEGIIHFAADKAVNESINLPLKYYKNNIGSLVTLLSLIEKYPVSVFVFSSSCTVYGNPDQVPVTEKAPIKKSRGCLIIRKKSLPVKPKPRENIIKANANGKIISVTMPIVKRLIYS